MGRKRKEIDISTYTGRFAVRLRELREAAKLSVEELAEKSGLPKGTLYDWESAAKVPGIDRFPMLANALGVKPGDLLPDE